jgi:hypothetical protein
MARHITRGSNGISFGYTHTVTATDVSDGYVEIDTSYRVGSFDISPIVQVKGQDGSLLTMTNSKITVPSQGIVRIDPAVVSQAEITTIETVADVAGSLGGTYFTLDTTTTSYYVWLDVDNGSVDPAPGGTGIEVDISADDDEDTIATAIQVAVDAVVGFGATVTDNVATVTNDVVGAVPVSLDVDTGFTLVTTQTGLDALTDAGYTLEEGQVITILMQPDSAIIHA